MQCSGERVVVRVSPEDGIETSCQLQRAFQMAVVLQRVRQRALTHEHRARSLAPSFQNTYILL